MTTTEGFNLTALVLDVCSTSDVADPQLLAKEVNRRIRKADRDAALEQALPVIVQHVVSRNRYSRDGQSYLDNHPGYAAAGSTSRKVAGIREAWRRMLRDRIAVGDSPSEWKFLADCTADDLAYAASIREEHARRNAVRAQQYRSLAELLAAHGVATVGQLPENVLAPALGAEE